MSNQTFVKKDRISFAQNSNEQIVIAPSNITTNALYIGPNSAIIYDTGSNVTNIDYLQGVTLSNQYIYADGTYLSNLPTTSAVTQSNLNSTITGLGSIGYVSSASLESTVRGLGSIGYISSSQLQSTVRGLGNIYLSSFNGSTTFLSSAVANISSLTVNSLTVGSGAGWVDFGAIRAVIVSSIQTNTGLLNASSITGDGSQIFNLNAISSLSLQSTVRGLGNIYLSSFNSISSLNISSGNLFAATVSTLNINASTMTLDKLFAGPVLGATTTQNLYPFTAGALVGFGSNTEQNGFYAEGHFRSTFTQVIQPSLDNDGFSNIVRINGNISTPNIIVSTIVANSISTSNISSFFYGGIEKYNYISTLALQSTVTGLGTAGYISTQQLQSTVTGLGNIYISSGGATQNAITSTIVGLGTFGYLSSLNSISSFNISSGNIFANVISTQNINVSTMRIERIFAGPILGATTTQNLYPFTAGAVVGFGSNSAQLGFYNEGHFHSTFTRVIQPTLDAGAFSNIVYINGNISTPNIIVSTIRVTTITASTINVSTILQIQTLSTINTGVITTSNIQTQTIQARGGTGLTLATSMEPASVNINLGYIQEGNGGGRYGNIYAYSTFTNRIIPMTATGFIGSTVSVLGTLSTQNQVVSTINIQSLLTASTIFASTISTQTFVGSNVFVNILRPYNTSRIASEWLTAAADNSYELGSAGGRWTRTFTMSTITNTITPMVGAVIPNPGVFDINSTIRMLGTVSTQNQVVSTINIQSLLTATSIIGDGSQIYNLPAISSLSLQSTIIGLGSIGYISSTQYVSANTITMYPTFSRPDPLISFVDSNANQLGYIQADSITSNLAIASIGGDTTLFSFSNSVYIGVAVPGPTSLINIVGANLDLTNNEIINVKQTPTINSAATNLVVSQSYSNIIDATIFNSGSFTQLLTSFPTLLQYKNTNTLFTNVWQVTFSFSGGLQTNDTNYAYYFSLSNVTQSFETTGQNFNSITPKCITSNFINSVALSDSYTDAYNLSSWSDNDDYCVLLYFQGTLCNKFKDTLIPCVYNSFIQPSIQYGS